MDITIHGASKLTVTTKGYTVEHGFVKRLTLTVITQNGQLVELNFYNDVKSPIEIVGKELL